MVIALQGKPLIRVGDSRKDLFLPQIRKGCVVMCKFQRNQFEQYCAFCRETLLELNTCIHITFSGNMTNK